MRRTDVKRFTLYTPTFRRSQIRFCSARRVAREAIGGHLAVVNEYVRLVLAPLEEPVVNDTHVVRHALYVGVEAAVIEA